MTTTTHPVAPEEIMAWLDGELAASEAHNIHAHVAGCPPCTAMVEELKCTSQLLSNWKIPDLPRAIDGTVREALARQAENPRSGKPPTEMNFRFFSGKLLAFSGVTVLVSVTVLISVVSHFSNRTDQQQARIMGYVRSQAKRKEPAAPLAMQQRIESIGAIAGAEMDSLRAPSASKPVGEMKNGPRAAFSYSQPAMPEAPMIARTASLTILVKDFRLARGAIDTIITRHGGYCAKLTVDTPDSGQRHFQASVRIPASELNAAVTDLKTLGRTLTETQSGEEVTQQHADLVARLENSRETEQRLRAILQQRAGKIEDVLEVEEEIARVRGEIESMEADQKVLEHRVSFATVDLELAEEYKEQFNPSVISTTGRMHNAFIEGMRDASGTVLGLVIFLEKYGPAILIWMVILGLPIFFIWRRFRRIQTHF